MDFDIAFSPDVLRFFVLKNPESGERLIDIMSERRHKLVVDEHGAALHLYEEACGEAWEYFFREFGSYVQSRKINSPKDSDDADFLLDLASRSRDRVWIGSGSTDRELIRLSIDELLENGNILFYTYTQVPPREFRKGHDASGFLKSLHHMIARTRHDEIRLEDPYITAVEDEFLEFLCNAMTSSDCKVLVMPWKDMEVPNSRTTRESISQYMEASNIRVVWQKYPKLDFHDRRIRGDDFIYDLHNSFSRIDMKRRQFRGQFRFSISRADELVKIEDPPKVSISL